MARIFVFFITLGILATLLSPQALWANDRIIAVVNGEIITQRQLENRVSSLVKNRRMDAASQGEVRRRVLNALIDQELVSQEARRKGVFITDADVTEAINAIKKQHNLSDAHFRSALAYNGTTMEAFRQDIASEILKSRVVGSQVMKGVVVTDRDVISFLRGEGPQIEPAPTSGSDLIGNRNSNNPAQAVRILVLPLGEKNQKQTLREIKKIKKEIESGKISFADAVRKYSHGPSQEQGGFLGDSVTVQDLEPTMRTAASRLSPGQLSEPVIIDEAVVLVTVGQDIERGKKSARNRQKNQGSLNDYSQEAVDNARLQLERYKMQERYVGWLADLQAKAIIRINL
ncbi:MAG: SurA N-terminal domain-containing protein [Candidatus Adiutrix sp.]